MSKTAAERGEYSGLTRTQSRWLRSLLVITALLFTVGLFTPMVTISKLIVFENSFSVASGIMELLQNRQYPLFVLIAGFSVVLPVLKLWLLWRLSSSSAEPTVRIRKWLRLMHDYGRWAMLDVMVVAVLIMTVKLGAIASIQVHFGLYIFGAAVLSIMVITHQLMKLMESALTKN
jgi:paraquat-inducible protein A